MTLTQVQYIINLFTKEVAKLNWHNADAEFLDDSDMGEFIVNIKVNKIFQAKSTELVAYGIAKCAECILNIYLPEKDMKWNLYSEPNYLGQNGQELDDIDDLKPGDIIQWSIYKEIG